MGLCFIQLTFSVIITIGYKNSKRYSNKSLSYRHNKGGSVSHLDLIV